MNVLKMKYFFILLIHCLVGVYSKYYTCSPQGKCYYPGCSYGNLTVTTLRQDVIVSFSECQSQAAKLSQISQTSIYLYYIPNYIRFHNLSSSLASSYLLVLYDHTADKLLMTMPNSTMREKNESSSTSPMIKCNIETAKLWNHLDPNPRDHRIEYYVFEEHRNLTGSNYTGTNVSTLSDWNWFNLSTWNSFQRFEGITIYGPVAGASVYLELLPRDPAPQQTANIATNSKHDVQKPNPPHYQIPNGSSNNHQNTKPNYQNYQNPILNSFDNQNLNRNSSIYQNQNPNPNFPNLSNYRNPIPNFRIPQNPNPNPFNNQNPIPNFPIPQNPNRIPYFPIPQNPNPIPFPIPQNPTPNFPIPQIPNPSNPLPRPVNYPDQDQKPPSYTCVTSCRKQLLRTKKCENVCYSGGFVHHAPAALILFHIFFSVVLSI